MESVEKYSEGLHKDFYVPRDAKVHSASNSTFKDLYGTQYGYLKPSDDCTVDGVTASGTLLSGYPLKAGFYDPLLFQKVTAISTGSLWVGLVGNAFLKDN